VEGKRASCDVYARIAVIQADANQRFRCGLLGPAWDERSGSLARPCSQSSEARRHGFDLRKYW